MIHKDLLNISYPLLIDGGLSNVLEEMGHNLNHKLWTAKLLESDPESIIQAHYDYLKSGATCITSSTYQASVPGLMAMGHDRSTADVLIKKTIVLAEQAIERARESGIIDNDPLIAASIGPYGAYLADGSEYHGNYGVSDDALREFHLERITLLEGSSADIFACETIPSFQEARVLSEILTLFNKPAWISFSCKDEHHINDGTKIEACASLFTNHPKVFAIGVNCTPPKYISGIIKSLKPLVGIKKIIVYPNSGEAYNAESKTWLGLSDPELFVTMAQEWRKLGADIIGGCCRIGPGHIRRMRETLKSNEI